MFVPEKKSLKQLLKLAQQQQQRWTESRSRGLAWQGSRIKYIHNVVLALFFSVRYNHQNCCTRGSSFHFSVFSAVNQLLQIPQSRLVSECALQPSS